LKHCPFLSRGFTNCFIKQSLINIEISADLCNQRLVLQKYCNLAVNSPIGLFTSLKIVHGKPRHCQSQGSVERANQELKETILNLIKNQRDDSSREIFKYARGANRSQFEDPELAVNARHLATRRAHPAFKFFTSLIPEAESFNLESFVPATTGGLEEHMLPPQMSG
jgi:hypothetical protein